MDRRLNGPTVSSSPAGGTATTRSSASALQLNYNSRLVQSGLTLQSTSQTPTISRRGRQREPLEWFARQKIVVGAARGLRYLHEECRVDCIIHRDMRPNNILITHDFEPLVGDFGLARWQPDGDTGVETRVIGTFGLGETGRRRRLQKL